MTARESSPAMLSAVDELKAWCQKRSDIVPLGVFTRLDAIDEAARSAPAPQSESEAVQLLRRIWNHPSVTGDIAGWIGAFFKDVHPAPSPQEAIAQRLRELRAAGLNVTTRDGLMGEKSETHAAMMKHGGDWCPTCKQGWDCSARDGFYRKGINAILSGTEAPEAVKELLLVWPGEHERFPITSPPTSVDGILTVHTSRKPAEPKATSATVFDDIQQRLLHLRGLVDTSFEHDEINRVLELLDSARAEAEPKATSATVEIERWIADIDERRWSLDSGSDTSRVRFRLGEMLHSARAEAKEAPEPERRDALETLRRELDERCRYYCDDKQSGHLNQTWLSGHRDALGVFEAWLKVLAKQPAKEAPAGDLVPMPEDVGQWALDNPEHPIARHIAESNQLLVKAVRESAASAPVGCWSNAHAELDKAGIPPGALDERAVQARGRLESFKLTVKTLEKERDAARQELAKLRDIVNKDSDRCLPTCDSHSHDEKCPQDLNVLLVQYRDERDAARQEAAKCYDGELRALRTMEAEAKRANIAEKELAAAKAEVERLGSLPSVACKERDEAIARAEKAEKAKADYERRLGCVHCQQWFEGEHRVQELKRHIEHCPQHPLFAARRHIDMIQKAMEAERKLNASAGFQLTAALERAEKAEQQLAETVAADERLAESQELTDAERGWRDEAAHWKRTAEFLRDGRKP